MPVLFLMSSKTDVVTSLREPTPFQRDVNVVSERRFFTLNNTVINPIDDTYLISGENICENIKDKSVIVLIASMPKEIGVRNVLRQTWIKALKTSTWPRENIDFDVKVVFLFGSGYTNVENRILKTENNVFEDIVQGHFIDNSQNLTRKILFGLKWVMKYCQKVRYVIKIDLDTFAHIPKLVRKVQVYDDTSAGKIFCRLNENSAPKREKNIFPFQFYPPYCSGSIYVISGKAIERLVHASERMQYVPMDDVFITGIVAKMAHINRISILPQVEFKNVPEWECSFRYSNEDDPVYLADAGYGPMQIKRIWKCLNEGPDLKDYLRLTGINYLLRDINIYFVCKLMACGCIILVIFLKLIIH